MTTLMQFIRLNAREAIVAGSNRMHCLVISVAGHAVDSVAGLASFGVAHLHRTKEATVLYR